MKLWKEELYHHGVLGMKWGVRRYQNKDGTLTELGKKRRAVIFVSGSSKSQDETSPYYRKDLPDPVKKELDSHVKNQSTFIVGDAPGIDRQVQNYLNKIGYKKVEVYGPGDKLRYIANDKWKQKLVKVPNAEEGSKEWLAGKDKAMSKRATEGLAVVLDEGANATRRNIERLIEKNKKVKVYELHKYGETKDRWW